MRKDQRTRMVRVLAALVLSMTAVSVLLSWLEPATQNETPLSVPRCVAGAQAAVDLGEGRMSFWKGVTIVPIEQPADRRTLTAVAPRDDVHFVIARTGNVVAHPSWKRQLRFEGADEIRIGLADVASSEPAAQMQWVALRSLLDALRPTFSIAGAPPRIRIEHGEPSVERSLAQAIRALLKSNAIRS